MVTGQPSYTRSVPEAPAFEVRDGVHVHRVPLGWAKGRERMTTRVAGYLRFLWGAWRVARKLVESERPKCVMTFHNPPVVGLIGAHLAVRYKLRFIYAVYDIHPDVLLATGWKLPRPLIWVWEAVNRQVFRNADAVIVLGEGMRQTLVEGKGVPIDKIKVIPPWGRPELTPMPRDSSIRQEMGIGEQDLLLLYAGNMGIMHPLDPLVDAAAALQGLPVRFLFVGNGVKRPHLVARVEKEGIGQVVFLPFQPEDRFVRLVAAADACFVVLEPGMERLAVPSRAFTFLSAGKPLITLMAPEAEIARLLVEAECGWNVTDGVALARLLRWLVQNPDELVRRALNARRVYEERFRRENAIRAYAELLEGNVTAGGWPPLKEGVGTGVLS